MWAQHFAHGAEVKNLVEKVRGDERRETFARHWRRQVKPKLRELGRRMDRAAVAVQAGGLCSRDRVAGSARGEL